MTKEILLKKFETNVYYDQLKPEIEQSMQVGQRMFISPNYTFYFMSHNQYQYIRNTQIIRLYYKTVRSGKSGSAYIMIECKDRCTIQLDYTVSCKVDLLAARKAYDTFCPQVLIGTQGAELSAAQMDAISQMKSKLFRKCSPVLCAAFLFLFISFLVPQIELNIQLWMFVISALVLICISIYFVATVNNYEKKISGR